MVRRSLVAALCVLVGLGAAHTDDVQPAQDSQEPPRLTFEVGKNHVKLSGDVSSVTHESILRQRVSALFPQKTPSFNLRERPALPPGWALISELALRAAGHTYTSRTEITPAAIHIRGITSDASLWRNDLSRIESRLLPGMQLQHEVTEIRATGSLQRQCAELFQAAQRGRKIKFPRSSDTLGTGAMPILDELIQIAADCPAAKIAITGHTDKSGDESNNVALSKARANAVASYLAAGGLPPDRFSVEGAGSSRPLVDATSQQADRQNRRIDIQLVFPER